MMRHSRSKRTTGTSLVEVLVVIVIFLVGILAVAQIFPGGFRVLNQARDATIASQLAQAERDRLLGFSDTIPGDIVSVAYFTDRVVPVAEGDPNLRPYSYDIRATGITQGGQAVGTNREWPLVSGPNLMRRVVGESVRLTPPRPTPHGFGVPVRLLFSPLDPNGWTRVGVVRLRRIVRNPETSAANPADLKQPYFYIDQQGTQVWIPRHPTDSRAYNLAMSFRASGTARTITDARFTVAPGAGYATVALNQFAPAGSANFNASPRSVEITASYAQVASPANFSANPFEFCLVDGLQGKILLNPLAYAATREVAEGDPRVDVNYDVLDWRILREEFRVPDQNPARWKLAMGSLKVIGDTEADGRPYPGLGVLVPDANGQPHNPDFVVVDVETGFVLMPESMRVDKSFGVVTFVDVDPGTPGLQARVWSPLANQQVQIDLAGRRVRALYQAKGEWAVNVVRAADRYTLASAWPPAIGEYAPGNGVAGTRPTRLYFSWSEVGKIVALDELFYRDEANNLQRLTGASFLVRESAADVLPYIDVTEVAPNAVAIDTETYGPARGVRGGSMRVLVNRNYDVFSLGPDPEANLREYQNWIRGWRRIASDAFVGGSR